ncbi:MAG TPA: phosphoribosylformylglycinamidine synthase subunit PurL [Blastocatellia bacterium]|nr:phosphoribosylformylglycinamidine synthase subunit PurL [Blastocatellia bacterium]
MIQSITPDVIAEHGLTPGEYDRIVELLGRTPTIVELGIFSVMWSEHCSYKSSRVHLKRLPTTGECVVQGPGENAGIVDIGEGYTVAFKIESHNHPSFIEPFQGAATGVGGILRDIFTMGARPIAAMNSLHFGSLDDPMTRHVVGGVVAGIGHYGNCFGVPTVGGEVHFAPVYEKNPLVNAYALGIVKRDQIFLGQAEGVGNPVIYVGAKTGRDGIHGATMASAEFDDEALEKRPTVQVGDPFLEKLLLEACLEAMRSGAVVGIQDMGAAGLTCSTCEMGGRAGTGVEIELDLVPQRETHMTPYEIMLSESQERMLLVSEHGRAREVIEIFNKWELDAVVIGRVTDDAKMRVLEHGKVVAEIPNVFLTDEAPVYHRPVAPPPEPRLGANEAARNPRITDPNLVLEALLASPNISSKEWVYEQYDHMVRTNTVVLPGSDASVLRVKETRKALAMTLDSNARYCEIDPRLGAMHVVAEAARNLSVSGARPLAVTNCLNFASPERPEVMRQFSDVIDGMSEACVAFGTPVTGGNVSFYNETEGRGIYPTPTIGMVGLIDNPRHITQQWFTTPGDVVLLVGANEPSLGGSEYLATVCGAVAGPLPALDLETEKAVQEACRRAITEDLVRSAHDCSDGGLAVALAEGCFSSYRKDAVGARIALTDDVDATNVLFGEAPSRAVLSVRPDAVARVMEIAAELGVRIARIGEVGGDRLTISVNGDNAIDRPVADLERAWRSQIAKKMAIGK